MKLAKIKAVYGECYQNAFDSMIANAKFTDEYQMRYVQGVVKSTTDGNMIGHAWVELVDPSDGKEYVFEPVPHGLVPKEVYYKRGEIKVAHRYDLERMLKTFAFDKEGEIGPWTDDVREALHTGETLAPEEDRELVKRARALGLPAFEVD